jgi:hypothetical protein
MVIKKEISGKCLSNRKYCCTPLINTYNINKLFLVDLYFFIKNI